MSFLLPNTEHMQLDAILPRIKMKQPADVLNFLARTLAPSVLHTPDELETALRDASKDAVTGEDVAISYVVLQRLNKPFTALATFEQPVRFAPAMPPVSLMPILILPAAGGGLNKIRLARVSRLFKNQSLCAQISAAETENEIFAAFLSAEAGQIAA